MTDLEAKVRMLADRQAILDCMANYCRGMDRLDMELVLSVYHDGAVDDHSSMIADARTFAEWAFGYHRDNQKSTQHCILNHYCELDDDVAHTETYFMFAAMNTHGPELALRGGRYIDRFERRNGRWAIAVRKVITDWLGTPGELVLTEGHKRTFNAAGKPARDRSDPSYERPLTIAAERLRAQT